MNHGWIPAKRVLLDATFTFPTGWAWFSSINSNKTSFAMGYKYLVDYTNANLLADGYGLLFQRPALFIF